MRYFAPAGILLAIIGGRMSILCLQQHTSKDDDDIPLELPEGAEVVIGDPENENENEIEPDEQQLELFEYLIGSNKMLKEELEDRSDHSSDWEDIDSDEDEEFFDHDDDDDDDDDSDAAEELAKLMNDPAFIAELIQEQHKENIRLRQRARKDKS
eukprot:TRINITY_DN7513_c0_g1_i1.p1 TRINITY_DN7513_c0_g1~~TRINITY_DN7513_c0_g1_i1.p1  ORF type:complete len:155 (+),score=50.24 TRINITY_DN7513_c0_g1_i1:101-565(+)